MATLGLVSTRLVILCPLGNRPRGDQREKIKKIKEGMNKGR
jgi:hypothetical protein